MSDHEEKFELEGPFPYVCHTHAVRAPEGWDGRLAPYIAGQTPAPDLVVRAKATLTYRLTDRTTGKVLGEFSVEQDAYDLKAELLKHWRTEQEVADAIRAQDLEREQKRADEFFRTSAPAKLAPRR